MKDLKIIESKFYIGLRLIPSSASVTGITQGNERKYHVNYNYGFGEHLKATFISVNTSGFAIASAMCLN